MGGIATIVLAATVTALGSAGAAEPPVVDWSQADRHLGEEVVVEGRVVGVECSKQSCQLAFEPTTTQFAAVVEALDFDVFPPRELAARYNGRPVRVRGTVVRPGRRPEIVLRKDAQLELVTEGTAPAADRQAETPDLVEQQAEILERITTVLDRIESLAEQLAVAEERMVALLGDIEQRQGELQAMLAAMTAPEEEPPLMLERPRRWEAMRNIKRGMRATDVERLFGPPSQVDQGSGWFVWYYEPGQSVSFDARGRVEAFVGF